MSLRSKWAAGKAVRAGLEVEGAYLNRYVLTGCSTADRTVGHNHTGGYAQIAPRAYDSEGVVSTDHGPLVRNPLNNSRQSGRAVHCQKFTGT